MLNDERIPNGEVVTIDADVMVKQTGQWQAHSGVVIGVRAGVYRVRDANGFVYRAREYDLRRSAQKLPQGT